MDRKIYNIQNHHELKSAGPNDLIRLVRAQGAPNAVYAKKGFLEVLVSALTSGELVHLSGPTGAAKSATVEALNEPQNFLPLCRLIGVPARPLKVLGVEMATYETPGELYYYRSIQNGCSGTRDSGLVAALRQAETLKESSYPCVHLREMGRVHSAAVQGGLLNLMTRGPVLLPDGESLDASRVAWIADSNYQAEQDSVHTLVVFDDALRRRFTINTTLEYPSQEAERDIVRDIVQKGGVTAPLPEELIEQVVHLGRALRQQKAEGSFESVPPPTIYGYLGALRLAARLPHLELQEICNYTLLGNASLEDQKHGRALFRELFSIGAADDEIGVEGVMF